MSSKRRPHLYDIWAAEKFGIEGWEWVSARCLPKNPPYTHVEISGAVFPMVYTSGPNKGQTSYTKVQAGTQRTVIFSNEEFDAWTRDWEAKTGKCSKCVGTGEIQAGWDRKTGATYRPCGACRGTGKHTAAADIQEATNA